MLKLKMRLDGKITSVNKVYLRGRNGGVFLAPEVKKYRDEVFPIVQKYLKDSGERYEGGLLTVKIDINENFFTKGGEIKRLDVDNMAKQIIDSVFPPLGIDDKTIFNLTMRKVHNDRNQPHIIVKITETPGGNPKKAKGNKERPKKL